MAKVREESGRKRKMKFEVKELEVLVEEVKKHTHTLQQTNLNITRRNAIWEAICERVNAVGKTRRTTDEVKRRWQDMRRRTKATLSLKKSSGDQDEEQQPAVEAPQAADVQQVQMFLCKEENTEIPGYDTLKEETVDREVSQSPPHSSHQLTPAAPAAAEPRPAVAEPRARPSVDDIDLELLQQQKKQSVALEDGLQSIAHELRAASNVSRALRRNSRTVAAHSRQLVRAMTGLTAAINALVRVIGDGVQAMGGSVQPDPAGVSPVLLGGGQEDPRGAQQSNPRKRKTPGDTLME